VAIRKLPSYGTWVSRGLPTALRAVWSTVGVAADDD
jgi:hypothetical protein